MGTESFPGVKSGRHVRLIPHPLLVPWSRKRDLYLYSPYGPYGLYRASVSVQRCTLPLPITLLPLWAVQTVQSLSACTTVHFNFTYTSNPPMGCTACREPQCLHKGALYLYLYLYSPYGLYSLYRASVPVQGCTLPLPIPLPLLWVVQPVQSLSACTRVHLTLPIPLLPLWALQPVQSLSVCTRVHFTFAYTSTPPVGRTACTEPQCLYKGSLYLCLYLYSPYGPYSLYRASVPEQRCTLPLPIPLLPLWAVQPVQSLSVCTRLHFTFTYTSTPPVGRTACTGPQCLHKGALYLCLYLCSPYGLYSLYRASVPVQGCTLPLPIPLLPLWALQPVQGPSAWTTVHFTFTYTFTLPMGRTACTELQCLYNGVL